MRDDFTYEPARIEVAEGETIEFVVVNEGRNQHELLIGDDKKQQTYEQAVRDGGHDEHGMEVTGVTVDPGQEESFVFTVPKASGMLLYGCHVAGHYQAGMKGEFTYPQSSSTATSSESEATPESDHH